MATTKKFNPKSVKVKLQMLSLESFKTEAAKFPVGEKVIAFLDGKQVDDAVSGGKWKMVQPRNTGLTLDLPFAVVTMDQSSGGWTLRMSRCANPASEEVKELNVAFWKVLTTAWHVGIRGVIC